MEGLPWGRKARRRLQSARRSQAGQSMSAGSARACTDASGVAGARGWRRGEVSWVGPIVRGKLGSGAAAERRGKCRVEGVYNNRCAAGGKAVFEGNRGVG